MLLPWHDLSREHQTLLTPDYTVADTAALVLLSDAFELIQVIQRRLILFLGLLGCS